MSGVIAALVASALYYLGFAIFKVTADRMERLRGAGPFRMAVVLLGHPLWLLALTVLIGGSVFETIAFSALEAGEAAPLICSGLAITFVVALTVFGERLTAMEWFSLVLIGAAMVLVALSVGRTPPLADGGLPFGKLLAITIPTLTFPYLLIRIEDRRPDGRHARRISGVAYGVIAGIPLGTAELAIRGMAGHRDDGVADIAATPYPYVMVVMGGLAYGIIMLGFQKCRSSVVIALTTIMSKTYLLLMGMLLFGDPWPHDLPNAAMGLGGLVLTVVALALFPRYEPVGGAPDTATPPVPRAAARPDSAALG